jgi:hypothetical protein
LFVFFLLVIVLFVFFLLVIVLFVFFLLVIVLSVFFRFVASDYPVCYLRIFLNGSCIVLLDLKFYV